MFIRKTTLALVGVLVLGLAACENEGPKGTSDSGGSSHNAGRNCIECHNLKYAGTLYSSASGNSTVSGGTVVVTETDGTVIRMSSDRSGNFYSSSGNPSNGYTAAVEGNTVQMVQNATNGGCSVSGCHDGSATPRVYRN